MKPGTWPPKVVRGYQKIIVLLVTRANWTVANSSLMGVNVLKGRRGGGGGDMVFPLYAGPQGFDLTPLMGESIAFGKATLHRGGANDMLQSGPNDSC